MSILDRWLRRTDDARRMKGDPPPTYLQLVAKVADLEEARLALLQQCELLDQRNARLRAQNKDLRESNLRLLNDANQMRRRLPRVADEPKPTLREERIGQRFPSWPETTYEATYGPVPETGKDELR